MWSHHQHSHQQHPGHSSATPAAALSWASWLLLAIGSSGPSAQQTGLVVADDVQAQQGPQVRLGARSQPHRIIVASCSERCRCIIVGASVTARAGPSSRGHCPKSSSADSASSPSCSLLKHAGTLRARKQLPTIISAPNCRSRASNCIFISLMVSLVYSWFRVSANFRSSRTEIGANVMKSLLMLAFAC